MTTRKSRYKYAFVWPLFISKYKFESLKIVEVKVKKIC